ncbi:hypothetical protein MGMO_37c00050 [Methyloglobulus morosus KoM1]|uniref:Uncharacterized protein n=1 Tax=Methyloglobulus morosus KoM1 TaxID=1116472 RepID=V5BZ15_9GAMM|nr:hypothetical protein MGMO_37c00050 [Methyloglobulus morosus KoM1]
MSTYSKVLIVLAVASAISVLSISSALADHGNGHGRGNRHNNHGGNQGWRGDHDGYRYQPGYRQQPYGYGYGNRQPYYNYAQPVYVPPPVYYGPMQSPGVSLFFPLNIRQW